MQRCHGINLLKLSTRFCLLMLVGVMILGVGVGCIAVGIKKSKEEKGSGKTWVVAGVATGILGAIAAAGACVFWTISALQTILSIHRSK